MKSAFCAIWSSVMPISKSSLRSGFQEGSTESTGWFACRAGLGGSPCKVGIIDCVGGGIFVVDEFLSRCSRLPKPPSRLWLLVPLLIPRAPPALFDPNGCAFVLLLAFFSRSSIFFLNCFASFSSTNESPARHSSSSNEWKYVRSWLYWKVSYISWSHITPRLVGFELSDITSIAPMQWRSLPIYPPI